jgi:thymidylate kinase
MRIRRTRSLLRSGMGRDARARSAHRLLAKRTGLPGRRARPFAAVRSAGARRRSSGVASPRCQPLLAAAFRALDDAGVRWCLLRGEDDLAAPAGDVDVLVASRDVACADATLATAGFARLPAWGHGPHRFFLGYDRDADAWLKLDVVGELAFGPSYELRSRATAACLRRRRRHDGVAVLDDADAFWCLLLHRLLDKRSVGAAGPRLARLAASPGVVASPLAAEVGREAPPGCDAAALVDAARDGATARLEAAAPRLAAAWRSRRPLSSRVRRARVRAARRLAPLARSRRGLTVALLGPDGAGKSSAAAAVARSFPLPVSTIYMSPATPARARSAPRGVGLALLLGAQLARWLRGQRHRAAGRVVLFDRYAYDALLPARWALGRRGRLRRWLVGHGCPPPALTVVLDAPSGVLYERKREQPAAVLEADRMAYLRLADRREATAVLDATADADRVRRELTAAIWAAYRRRSVRPRRRLGAQAPGRPRMRRSPGASARAKQSRSRAT